jgi:hypothetical protein
MPRNIYFLILFIISIINNHQVYAMQETSGTNVRDTGEGFGLVYRGGHGYGWNNIGIWLSGKIRIGRSDTIDEADFSGVGIFDAQLSPDDLREANEIHRQLCLVVDRKPVHDTPAGDPSRIYDVDCLREGKIVNHQGMTDELPEELHSSMYSFYQKVRRIYVDLGRAVVKLDVDAVSVQRDSGKLLVSVRFVNSGQYPITILTPDRWSSVRGNQLNVGGFSVNGKEHWSVELAGLPQVNKPEATDGTLAIAAGTSIAFQFLAVPGDKISKGKYKVGVLVAMGASASDVAPSLGYVDFHSDREKHLEVTFDRDYPSTPEELENYEAQKREEMSSQPVFPGSKFVEDGYYRAVSILDEQRSRFVTRFRKDAHAPAVEGVVDEKGQPILHPRFTPWIWEADLGLQPHGTGTACYAGESCPRSGRWFARKQLPFPMFPPTYDDSANRVIYRKAGQIMPGDVRPSGDDNLRWEWIGV